MRYLSAGRALLHANSSGSEAAGGHGLSEVGRSPRDARVSAQYSGAVSRDGKH